MVTSTWRAPAWTAASVLAVARPEVVVAVDADDGAAADAVDDRGDERPELGRDGVADGVGDVDRGGAGIDDRLVDAQQELRVGARGILGAELDLGVRAERLAAVADPLHGRRQRLLAGDAQLVLEVDVAGGDEDVQVRPLGDADGLHGPLRVAVAAARQGRHGHALGLLGDAVDRLPVAGRGGREAGLDDVDVEAHELAGDLQLLLGGEPGAGRLLTVAQRGVEDADAPRIPARGSGSAHRRSPLTGCGISALPPSRWPTPGPGRR